MFDALDVDLLAALREHPRAGVLELSRITRRRPGHGVGPADRLERAGVSPATARTSTCRPPGSASRRSSRWRSPRARSTTSRATSTALPAVLEAHATTGSSTCSAGSAARSHEDLQQALLELNRSSAVVRSTSVVALSQLVPWRTLPLLEAEAAPGAGRSAMGPRVASPPGTEGH